MAWALGVVKDQPVGQLTSLLKFFDVPAPIIWTRFCNSGRLSHGISLTGFEG
jgi:hypothetical protein